MRILLFLCFLMLWSQNAHGDKIFDKMAANEKLLILQEQELRSLSDLWNSVKNSATNTWNSVKYIAINTSKKITEWVQNVKAKSKDINNHFQSRIQKMREEINSITDIKATSELVRKCIKKEQNAINKILKQILKSVTNCIANSIQSLSLLEVSNAQFLFDETVFMNKVQNELFICLNDKDIEKCFNNVRQNVYDDLGREEQEILKNKDEQRAITDDVLSTIASCASDGLINASTAITNTTIRVIKCVSKG